ncbi:MAG TPA: methyltransferase domain-containing protein [Dehalococcoidia bacterium]|nr:methyltransferase domain-containing protein [Dehalococcoidia bacterium]
MPKGHRWHASFYDRLMRSTERRLMAGLRARLLGPLEGAVLEIGAGTGANLPYYAHAARVIATEPDPYMLRRARERLRELNHPAIDLRLASAEALPFPDASFDHVVATLVFCTVPDPEPALREVCRVLKPDGRFHFVEHVRADGVVGRAQDLIRPVWKFFAAGCVINRRTAELIERAGFAIESLERRSLQFGVPLLIGVARPAEPQTSASDR